MIEQEENLQENTNDTQETNDYTADEPASETEVGYERQTLKLKNGEDGENVIVNGVSYPKELIEQAEYEGWKPYESLKKRGKEDKYLPPDEFVKRGAESAPFLTKQLEKYKTEMTALRKINEQMYQMIQSQIDTNHEDKIDKLRSKLSQAKEEMDVDKIENLSRQLSKLESEKQAANVQQNNIQQDTSKLIEDYYCDEWSKRNQWIYDSSNPKSQFAGRAWSEIKASRSHLSIEEKLEELDNIINRAFPQQQKSFSHYSPSRVNNGAKNLSINPFSIENLKPEYKKSFEDSWERCKNFSSYKDNKKAYEKIFLSQCREEYFKKV